MEPDLVLLDRWCAGDQAAGNELFRRHFESLYRFFRTKTDGEVDDLVQETLLQCLRGRDTFKRQCSFRTYLFAIARHVLMQHWRRKAGSRTTIDFEEVSIASLSTGVDARLARNSERARMISVLRSLPAEQQVLLEMYYWEGFEREQLAEIYEVETATIGTRLHRAREALRRALAGSPADLDAWARALAQDDPA